MNDCIPLIGQQMKQLAKRWFTAEPLAELAERFIEDKLQEASKFGRLTVIHYRMFGGGGDEVFRAAAAVELSILASDILDDLQDQDAPAKPWMQVPGAAALHVASSLLTLSQQTMLDCTEDDGMRLALAGMMNRYLLQAANGQMLDIMNEITDEQSYLDMVRQKSSMLLSFACMTGVMLAGHPWHGVIEQYAVEIGIAAQLRNDIRDLLRWDDKSDFLQRKRTLLTLFLLESLGEEDKWIHDYFDGRLSVGEVAGRRQSFEEACERTGTILYGSVMSRMHYNRFEELLDSVQESGPWKSTFLQLLNQEIA
ncbi:polyprenyl synthetase family protein [Paenibacillus arenilitoris]|uniref:Polyprenyl synthetase family protein n=1 Tax=Paenibacillus arenilitoris TaxID=2772299 RepID=A0A927CMZ8_9BACL|nr:polyprenyl synthetase family protein [Paenibacillus arenilitoris]MBD2871004.1 polyprenyl synthetase family protein [Paenibacillus arenilitoris]